MRGNSAVALSFCARLALVEEWHHPDGAGGQRASANATFKSLAEVLVHGDVSAYFRSEEAKTHWRNWPEAGTL